MYSILRLGFLAGVNGHSFMLIFLFSFPYTVYVFDNVHRVCIVFTRNHETSHASPLQRPSMDCSCLGPYPSVCFSQYIYVTDGNIMYLTDASRFLISCVIQHYAPVVGWRNRCIMLIMTLDPSWRQTLRLPPPGIEPGSPASQAGTLPKELSRQLTPELRIQDLYPRSRILIFSHSGSWIQNSNKREG